ncbi:SDR family oxidoreductase [Halostreptopolyspora alba]|uniref:SDR family oxidoreductase n=1 Tax=Halostreptopolyspora alba TaxID=2487137 RepID=A0A3N0E9E3_9ACTN|nr:SDR family oxidoreductase [Nocardiopsaceae bacterium YIM 96095]
MPDAGKSRAPVLLTGATGGVGRETTRALTERGFRVYAAARNPGALAGSANVHPIRLDVSDPASVASAAEELRAQGETSLSGVVNNAGIIVQGPLELVPDDELRRQFDVNVHGPARVIRAFLPFLRESRGRLINITAGTARLASPFLSPVSASKAALQSISDALRVELAAFNVPVVVIEPGALDTQIFDKAATAAEKARAEADPRTVRLYRNQITAMDKAQESLNPSSPGIVADAVVKALTVPRPKPRYTVGNDLRLLGLLTSLPLRTRDRLISQVMGLNKTTAENR